jgi:hypothetical protein
MDKVPQFDYTHLPLSGMALDDAVKLVVDEMVRHYNKYIVDGTNGSHDG